MMISIGFTQVYDDRLLKPTNKRLQVKPCHGPPNVATTPLHHEDQQRLRLPASPVRIEF